MKSLRLCLFVLLVTFASASCSGGDSLIRHMYGDAGVVLNDALEAATEGDLDVMKNSLSKAYLDVVSAAELEATLRRTHWSLEEFTILSVYEFEGFRCFVVKFTDFSEMAGKKLRSHSTIPVFLKNEAGSWKMWNFPFAPSIARNYPKERFCLSPEN